MASAGSQLRLVDGTVVVEQAPFVPAPGQLIRPGDGHAYRVVDGDAPVERVTIRDLGQQVWLNIVTVERVPAGAKAAAAAAPPTRRQRLVEG